MKHCLFIISLIFSATLYAQQKDFSGTWEGKIDSGVTHLRLELNFQKGGNDVYTGSLKIPEQGISNMSFNSVSVNNEKLTAFANPLQGTFRGYLINDSTMKGVWQRGMTQLPLIIKRTGNTFVAATSDNRERFDRMANFIVQQINNKQADNLYAQLDKAFKDQMPKEQFVQAFNRLPDQIGQLDSITYLEQYKEASVYSTISPKGKWELLLALDNKDSITGLFIRPAQGHSSSNRPQTPKLPYAYSSEDVEYDNADKSVHFGGTFSYPKTGNKFVTAIMITGSGNQDRDETLLEHKPFAVIADYLTKNGYAVLRIDDRGVGKTTGKDKEFPFGTSAYYAKDVEAAINYLRTRKEVSKIGLIGHSEGGFIAPMVAAKDNRIAFIISLAGIGVSGAEVLLNQQTKPMKQLLSDSAFQSFYALTQNTLQIIRKNTTQSDSIIMNKEKTMFNTWKKDQSPSVLKQLNATNTTPEVYINIQVKPQLAPWFKYFISSNPAEFWKHVKCPVLALNGEKDIQVYAKENTEGIQKELLAEGNKNVTVKIFPGLNHLFQKCNTCTIAEYAQIEETFSPDVLQTMTDWLNKNIKQSTHNN